MLSAEAFQQLANVPPEIEWAAIIEYKRTRPAYNNGQQDYMRFVGINQPDFSSFIYYFSIWNLRLRPAYLC